MVILITGCIKVNHKVPFLEFKDQNKRLREYLLTLKWAAKEKMITEIVFCENSGYKYNFEKYVNQINPEIPFEYLTFKGDEKMAIIRGKGYGEGEIIKYALKNSMFLNKCDIFCKITGKLRIKNLSLLGIQRNCNMFMNYKFSKAVDTRFYVIKRKDYEMYLKDAYKEVRDRAGNYLESVFYRNLKAHHVKYRCFLQVPQVEGISGSVGRAYDSRKRRFDDFLCRIQVYNYSVIRFVRIFIDDILNFMCGG